MKQKHFSSDMVDFFVKMQLYLLVQSYCLFNYRVSTHDHFSAGTWYQDVQACRKVRFTPEWWVGLTFRSVTGPTISLQ